MAPRGEERQVKVGDSSETSWEEDKVADVSAESEGSASGALQRVPFGACKGHGISGTGVCN